jgi:hypothetical protein
LDEELSLLPGALTPSLQEDVVRLGAWMPFRRVVSELHHFRHVDVSKSTAERLTERAGAAYVAVQTGAVEEIERKLPVPPPGPAQQFLSVDGAMVPLVGGEWAEVRTLVIGEVLPPQRVKDEEVVRTTNHTYFSRMIDANTFERLALVETQRRGVENAQTVAAVTDGAEWIQKFIDHHRHDAVRILDFPHAAEYVGAFAQVLGGADGEAKANWLHKQLHQLKTAGVTPLLPTLRQAVSQHAERTELTTALAYLEKREAHMQYPTFQAAGLPIGDGAVESANKLVVEARLKGSGMHWAPPHVNPMLALRNIVCSDRWTEAWPQITATLRQQARQRTTQRRHHRRSLATTAALSTAMPTPAVVPSTTLPPLPSSPPAPTALTPPLLAPAPHQPWRPPADHPWRRMPIGRARYKSTTASPTAKL